MVWKINLNLNLKHSPPLNVDGSAYHAIDLYHAVTILVMFPVSITVMKANIHCANMAPDYYFVQPQFGYYELEWIKIKMATP